MLIRQALTRPWPSPAAGSAATSIAVALPVASPVAFAKLAQTDRPYTFCVAGSFAPGPDYGPSRKHIALTTPVAPLRLRHFGEREEKR